jgi:O-antigen ligase
MPIVVWLGCSIALSPAAMWRTVPEAAMLTGILVVASSADQPVRLARGLVAVAALMAVHGLAQSAGWDERTWLSPFSKGVASTIGNPDLFGGFLILPFALALAAALAAPSWMRGIVALALAAAVLATEARAAWLGCLVVVAALVARERHRAVAAVVAVLVVGGVWLGFHPGMLSRVRSGGAMAERLWTWKLAAHAIREAPVEGTGPGTFRTVYLARQTAAHAAGADYFHYTEYAHCEPLHLWLELGAVGLGLFLWALVSLIAGWWRSPLRAERPALWWGIGAGTAGVLVNAGMSFPFHVPPTAVGCCALLGAAANGRTTGRPERRHEVVRWVPAALATLALAIPFQMAVENTALRDGQVLALAHRPDLALAKLDEAGRAMAADPRIGWYAANAARLMGDQAGALARIDGAIQREPDWFELHHERGMILKSLGRTADAEAAYRQSILINPGFASGWNNLGNLLGSTGRLPEAEAAQRRALALDPGSHEARQNLAITLMQEGRRREARQVLSPGL